MFVVWNYGQGKPETFDGVVLFEEYDDAFHALLNEKGHIGNDLSGDCYVIENVDTVIRGRTVGENLRDYYGHL